MSAKKRASLSNNSPLDQLFSPRTEREEPTAARRERPEVDAAPEPAAARPPEPPVEEAAPALRQTTILLYEDQSNWLDDVCYLAKRESGSIISKAAVIRALIDLAREYDVSLAGAQDDDEIRARLKRELGLR
jgi:hypothetical protein